jgi:ABC-type lipoprotein release transport system permease subunit
MIVLQTWDTLDVAGFAAVLATLSPALRALRIDPSTTLREE